ncbi:MAG: hypothetical protein IT381_10045 [Deltaproteobacteria bacterium]|nr:hypothetical protein [Deltaproteobacteria bacterium]
MRRLRIFIFALVGIALFAEIAFRVFEPFVFEASHRALFKAALLRRQPSVDTIFLGSSRHEQALRPALFDAMTGRHSFNLAVSGTSFELYLALLDRAVARSGTRFVVAELSEPLLTHEQLAWEAAAEGSLARHVALVRLRSALRHDSLVRLLGALVVAGRFDGSETMGSAFLRALLWGHAATCASACEDALAPPPPEAIAPWAGDEGAVYATEAHALADRFTALQAHGARVILVVPPLTTARAGSLERQDRFRRFAADVAALAGAPLYDFARLDADAIGFADSQHLDGRGAEAYTAAVARLLTAGDARAVQ